jgi:hypothetical protein
MSSGWGEVAAGIGQLAAGADFEDVAGELTKSTVLGFVPLYGVAAAVGAAIGLIRSWTGNAPRVAVLGAILRGADADGPGELMAEKLVENAAVQVWHGFTTFHGSGPAPLMHPGNPEHAWRWAEDFADAMAKVYAEGGPDALVARFQKSATWAQYLDACRMLYAWARETQGAALKSISIGSPINGPLFKAYGIYTNDPKLIPGVNVKPELTAVFDKGGLFHRIGVPKYPLYVEALAALQTPSMTPVSEIFPGANAVEIKPIHNFEDQGGAAAPTGAVVGAPGAAASLTAGGKAAAPQSRALPVALGIGALAVALAVL